MSVMFLLVQEYHQYHFPYEGLMKSPVLFSVCDELFGSDVGARNILKETAAGLSAVSATLSLGTRFGKQGPFGKPQGQKPMGKSVEKVCELLKIWLPHSCEAKNGLKQLVHVRPSIVPSVYGLVSL